MAWCFFIIQPFLLILLWAIILAVALFPLYVKWISKFKEQQKKLATILFTLAMALMLFVPSYFIVGTVVENTNLTLNQIRSNSLQIPQPQESVKDWPMIGEQLHEEWKQLSDNAKEYAIVHKDLILEKGKGLLGNVTGFIGSLIAFFISFLVSILFMYHSSSGYKTGHKLLQKLVGDDTEEILHMSRDTIRSVVKGILLVALIQTGLAFIGFKAIGLPAAGLFAFIILVTAIIQIPAMLTMIPAIIIAFSISDTTPAIIFTLYCVLVGLSDNILKPMLLGKGLNTPMIIILIGTIGGLLLHGIIGLFLGAVVLAIMHRMYMYWVNTQNIKE